MADYREISQTYAHGAIKAGVILNGGAAIGVLTQVGDLVQHGMAGGIKASMAFWALGTISAAACWLAGFLSARYVDKAAREDDARYQQNIATSDRWMGAAIGLIVTSGFAFVAGCVAIISAIP